MFDWALIEFVVLDQVFVMARCQREFSRLLGIYFFLSEGLRRVEVGIRY
jgi:hypothetical protein